MAEPVYSENQFLSIESSSLLKGEIGSLLLTPYWLNNGLHAFAATIIHRSSHIKPVNNWLENCIHLMVAQNKKR